MLFLKNNRGQCKKDKQIEIQDLIKRFTKRVFKKKTKVTQIFKAINYWEITANTRSN